MSEKKNKESLERLRRHRLGIRSLIDAPQLKTLAEKTGTMGQGFIEMHNVQGRFLGGDYASKGYSETTLPVFFFGDWTLIERTGNIRITNPEMNVSDVLIRKEDIIWTTSQDGRKRAWVRGGYRTWLKATRPGKNLSRVDHTFTGAMLRAFTHEIIFRTDSAQIRWYVRSPQDKKAFYTNQKRRWMGLFNDEIDQIVEMARNEYSLAIINEVSTE